MQRQFISDILGIEHPLIVAPMFLISNTSMVKAALDAGASAAFPALNYRTDRELRAAIEEIKNHSSKAFGVNLIVNKSNPKYKGQLKTLIELEVPYIITSLGNPKEVIEQAHNIGSLVFCDVTGIAHAEKVKSLGADGLVAVSQEAGGHAGNVPGKELVRQLIDATGLPVLAAGGIANHSTYEEVFTWGAAGAYAGTVFIASEESPVSEGYKQACISYGEKDIVRTNKMTGTPLTVINTPYMQKIGTKANFLEWLITNSPRVKKWAKMVLALRGMNKVRKSAFSANYDTVWCAGPAIEHVKAIRPMEEIIAEMVGKSTSSSYISQ